MSMRLGMEKHPATRAMPTRREDFDRRLCKLAVEMRIPTLAIGVGMQQINVICGGTLFQHIPEAFAKPLHHRDPVEETLRHIIEIVPGTCIDTIYGPGEIRVNSQHHMCVDQVAKRFRVSATSPDGVVEAYESIDDNWYVSNGEAPWAYNWQEKEWLIPMGVRVGRLFKTRKGTWNGYVEYRWPIEWKDWPGAVAEDTVRVQVSYTPKP